MHVKIRFALLSFLLLSTGISVVPLATASGGMAEIKGKAPLELASGSAMVVDLQTNKVIYANNADEVVPIASITKLMTAMVVLDAKLPLDEIISVDLLDLHLCRELGFDPLVHVRFHSPGPCTMADGDDIGSRIYAKTPETIDDE